MKEPRPDAIWDDSRCKELQMLERLLNEVSSINSGNRCLERIAQCIADAEKLRATDYDTARSSFVRFLSERAVADRFPKEPT